MTLRFKEYVDVILWLLDKTSGSRQSLNLKEISFSFFGLAIQLSKSFHLSWVVNIILEG